MATSSETMHGAKRSVAGGNPALLAVLKQEPAEPPFQSTVATQCQSWPIHTPSKTVIAVRCYYNGRLIQCCGHGLLSAAYHWQQQLDRDELTLQMNNSTVQSWRDGQITWLSFNTLTTHSCEIPDWVEQVFPDQIKPLAAATAGGEQGYLVLQWPDGFSLAQLPLPRDCLVQHSQRALICTSAQPATGENAIELRYFAPQHGVSEDIATGSAIRILSHYWSGRFEQLIAKQCSPVGGLLLANFNDNLVEIGGRCVATSAPVHSSMETSHD
jgi:predicted PhzF superfamily epimerase YddE/YHI9